MGRHHAMRRSGTSFSNETVPPDPYDGLNAYGYEGSAAVDTTVTRATVGTAKLYDVTADRTLKETIPDQSIAFPNDVFLFMFTLEESHIYLIEVTYQFYPSHDSNTFS